MKHFIRKHKHHFGLWALSGVFLVISMLWWGRLNRQNSVEPVSNIGVRGASGAQSQELQTQSSSSPSGVSYTGVETKPSAPVATSSTVQEKISLSTPQENSLSTTSTENNIPVTFVIAFPQETRTFTVNAHKGDTVYDAMKVLARADNFDIQFKEFSGLGAMVQSINGAANDARANKFWIYYINGALAKAGVSSVKIHSQDVIKWQYETGKE